MNPNTITKCDNERCGWRGPYQDQVLRPAEGGGDDYVCPKCGHDTFTLPLDKPCAVIVLQLQVGEDLNHYYAERASLILDADGNILKNRSGPLDPPWQVWEVNDLPEWILARTREEAVMGYLKHYENWHGVMDVQAECDDFDSGLYPLEDIKALSEEAMERLRFRDDDGVGGDEVRTFREELARREAEGPKCEMFASSEW